MKNNRIKEVIEISMIAALYVCLTLALTPLSYGDVQFRLSEVLMLLILYKRRYAISMILGCFVSNIFSPVGAVDIVFGTLATAIAIIPMLFIKNLFISSIFPSISNGIIVGLELAIVYELPIIYTMLTVFIGEAVVVSLIGVPLFKSLQQNEGFMKVLEAEPIKSKFNIDGFISFNLAILVISAVCYIKLSLRIEDDINETLFYHLRHKEYLFSISFLAINLISLLVSIFIKNKYVFIIDIILDALFISILIILCHYYQNDIKTSFYIYLIVPILMILNTVLKFISTRDKEDLNLI